jgi:hypothetical protein
MPAKLEQLAGCWRVKMTLKNSQGNDDAPRVSKRRGFFSFSGAATAEDAGV